VSQSKKIDLKKLETKSNGAEKLAAALRGKRGAAWTSPFAASGGKQPPFAPPRRRR
jgi:hypothetical protein